MKFKVLGYKYKGKFTKYPRPNANLAKRSKLQIPAVFSTCGFIITAVFITMKAI